MKPETLQVLDLFPWGWCEPKRFILSKGLFHLPCNAVAYNRVIISFDHSYITGTASPPARTKSDVHVSGMLVALPLHATQLTLSFAKCYLAFYVHGYLLKETEPLKGKGPATPGLVIGPWSAQSQHLLHKVLNTCLLMVMIIHILTWARNVSYSLCCLSS